MSGQPKVNSLGGFWQVELHSVQVIKIPILLQNTCRQHRHPNRELRVPLSGLALSFAPASQLFYFFWRQINNLTLICFHFGSGFPWPREWVCDFYLSLFRKEHVLGLDVTNFVVAITCCKSVLFLGCAESVQKMPEFRFFESGAFGFVGVDGVAEKVGVPVVGDLGYERFTVSFWRLVQAEHLSILLSWRGSSKNLFFSALTLFYEIWDFHCS